METAGRAPTEYIEEMKAAGMTVIHKCVAVKHALKAQSIGCDMVVIDGYEAAGHIGAFNTGTMVLTPSAVRALSIPVITAGGVCDGRSMAAALMLGAEGVYMGTRFVLNSLMKEVAALEAAGEPFEKVAPLVAGYRTRKFTQGGKDLDEGRDFADLIREINAIPGDFLIRFMTSHPRDATEKLFRTMAECEKCAKHIHLPVQSGSSRVLRAMNRHYDREKYLALVDKARSYMPELVLTTDIIVGFPGETAEDFAETLSLVERVRYDAMFTFIFSPREGTPAAAMPDPVPREEKQRWFDTLVETANRISAEKHAEYAGRRLRVLVDGETGRGEYNLSARTNGGRLVHLKGEPELVGRFIEAEITDWNTWALYGVPAL